MLQSLKPPQPSHLYIWLDPLRTASAFLTTISKRAMHFAVGQRLSKIKCLLLLLVSPSMTCLPCLLQAQGDWFHRTLSNGNGAQGEGGDLGASIPRNKCRRRMAEAEYIIFFTSPEHTACTKSEARCGMWCSTAGSRHWLVRFTPNS